MKVPDYNQKVTDLVDFWVIVRGGGSPSEVQRRSEPLWKDTWNCKKVKKQALEKSKNTQWRKKGISIAIRQHRLIIKWTSRPPILKKVSRTWAGDRKTLILEGPRKPSPLLQSRENVPGNRIATERNKMTKTAVIRTTCRSNAQPPKRAWNLVSRWLARVETRDTNQLRWKRIDPQRDPPPPRSNLMLWREGGLIKKGRREE